MTDDGRSRVRVVVKGRVQGVGFRAYTERVASKAGVVGWVRNRPDGAVELEAEASPTVIESFLGQVRRGPLGSRVDAMETDSVEPLAREAGFSVRF